MTLQINRITVIDNSEVLTNLGAAVTIVVDTTIASHET